jgi:dolichol-phosphate mannosyltransferase
MNKKLISIIIPIYNEEENIPLIFSAVEKVMEKESDYDCEIIFIDDGSSDDSAAVIGSIIETRRGAMIETRRGASVHVLEFSRNFGKEPATSAGLEYAKGSAVIMIDADLQHPPSLIPEFLRKWEAGAEVVVGVREKSKGVGFFKKLSSMLYYHLINAMTETTITPRATDYRLLDKKVVKELNKLTEKNRMTRALIDWLGFKREYVYFVAEERANGEASYGFLQLLKLAVDSMVAMSLLPLKLAGYGGVVIILFSGSLGGFIFVEKYLLHDPWGMSISGSAILAVIILFLVGIILASLGLMALYIASIHAEVVDRPLYVIRNKK